MLRLILTATLFAWPALASAAMITITPSYVQSYDSSQTPLGVLADDGAATPVGGYLQFEFRIELSQLTANEDFWIAAFNVNLGPGLANSSGWLDPATAQANGYYPASPSLDLYDSNGAAVGGVLQHWDFGNADFGTNSNDLQSIIVEVSPAQAANRQYGEANRPGAGTADALGFPTLIGSIVVQRTEAVTSIVSVSPIAGSPWGTYVSNASGTGAATSHSATSFSGASLTIPQVPEPATLVQAMAAALTLAGGCWRKLTKTRAGLGARWR